MNSLINKANVLVEALPYIQRFRNSIMVVKFGGSSMEDPALVASTMRDIVLLEAIGIRPVVVHGGGNAISAEVTVNTPNLHRMFFTHKLELLIINMKHSKHLS